jgi:hypothetical protein
LINNRLVVGVGIVRDPSANILKHLKLTDRENILLLTLPQALHNGVDAQVSVQTVKYAISEVAASLRSQAIELYYVGPAAFAVALGHRWNGLPPTQLYELVQATGDYMQAWECETTGTDRYGRSLGNCFIEGEDVSAWMVRSGWALSFVRYSHAYDADEVAARDAHAGLWSGAFIAPWDWRHRNKETVILGAAAVPINAQALLLGAVSASEAPSPDCVIKGNVNRNGERIYHLPGQLNYAHLNMEKGLGERWFCTEAEAEAAGSRKASR